MRSGRLQSPLQSCWSMWFWGGAHADILTDGVQGAMMLGVAIAIMVMFANGFGVEGGLDGVMVRLENLDPKMTGMFYEGSGILDSYWDFTAIFLAHLSLGMLPHIGNKVWALKEGVGRTRFLLLCLVFGCGAGFNDFWWCVGSSRIGR